MFFDILWCYTIPQPLARNLLRSCIKQLGLLHPWGRIHQPQFRRKLMWRLEWIPLSKVQPLMWKCLQNAHANSEHMPKSKLWQLAKQQMTCSFKCLSFNMAYGQGAVAMRKKQRGNLHTEFELLKWMCWILSKLNNIRKEMCGPILLDYRTSLPQARKPLPYTIPPCPAWEDGAEVWDDSLPQRPLRQARLSRLSKELEIKAQDHLGRQAYNLLTACDVWWYATKKQMWGVWILPRHHGAFGFH